tara:strand:+ start:486 stop:851 length:366 start_codon:yes stop_codon:yes gene_type:complete
MIKMNVTIENTNGKLIDVTIEVYSKEQFVNCCDAENMQEIYARAKAPEKTPGIIYHHKIVKAYIDKEARRAGEITMANALCLCSKSIEKFTLDNYHNKQIFFIELMSHTPYELQYHYLIEN